jgi:hypothetical protein
MRWWCTWRSAANPAPKMHQFSLSAELERITDRPAAASIPHDKKNSKYWRERPRDASWSQSSSGACADAANPYANERTDERASARARGDRRVARGILIRVQDVAELAMTVAADTIHTAFFGASFWDQLPNRRLSIYWMQRPLLCLVGIFLTSN